MLGIKYGSNHLILNVFLSFSVGIKTILFKLNHEIASSIPDISVTGHSVGINLSEKDKETFVLRANNKARAFVKDWERIKEGDDLKTKYFQIPSAFSTESASEAFAKLSG